MTCSSPDKLVAFCGTATEIGKTWVAARTALAFRGRGVAVAARKPVQSFAPDEAPEATDAAILAAATDDDADVVCPPGRWYPVPMAPPMAAAHLGRACPTIAELLGELRWPAGTEVGILETVGGVRSPLAEDGDSRDLVRAAGADAVVLVAGSGLGAIDAVRSGVDALHPMPTVVFLNRFDEEDELHLRNRAWLADRDGYQVAHAVDALVDVLSP